MAEPKTRTKVLVVAVVLAAAIFVLDLFLPLGVAGGVPYVLVVLVLLESPRRRDTLVAAIACSGLTIIAFLFSPAGGVLWKVLSNRALALFAIWVTTMLGLQRKRAEEDTQRLNQELEQRVKERTAELRTSEMQFQELLGAAPDAIVIISHDGGIRLANTQAEKIFGYPREELLGKPVEILLPERFHERHPRHRAGYFSDPWPRSMGVGLDLWGRRKDGSEFPVEISLSPLKTKEGLLVTSIIRDVSERKQAEEEIRKLNTELEQRVVERTAELATTIKELEAFTYSVSHDLRAPLRHIDGFSKILLEDFGPRLDSSAQHYLRRIQNGAMHMGRLVDDLLNLSRVGRQKLIPQVTGLNSLVEEALAALKPETEGREIEWQIGHLPFVECDPSLTIQVFSNLLSNAIKYTRPRERTLIQVDQMTVDGQPVVFVRDNGVGFSMKYADKLFGVFQRLHRAEDFEGTGVGLATVQRIIHKHGGRIWAEAELDKGATFYFTLGTPKEDEPENKNTKAERS